MIMTSTGLPEMGTMLAKSTGSFIATVGLIIMLGAGVGEVATRTGAAVAQMTFTHKIFGPMLMAAGVPPQGTTAVLLASSQVDWFGPFPSSDMFGQMGLAQSTHLKYMLYNGWAIVLANIVLFAVLFQVLV